jgi:DNA-binding LytR/AlgR family response regulator
MNRRLNQFVLLIKKDLGLLLSIGFGVFLFVLFFEPFPIDKFEFNNRILFLAGLGAIVFLIILIVRVAFPWLMTKYEQRKLEPVLPAYMSGFIILVLSSTALAIYLHYIGSVEITFFIMFKIGLICLGPPLALRLYDVIKELQQQNQALLDEKKSIQNQVEKYEEDYLNKTIEFASENMTETFSLLIADVAFIKSADNYVEIIYKEGSDFKKKLLRNTLKNIEQQIRSYSNFVRCHRICIVNKHFIEKLNKDSNSHWLTVKGYSEQIPVSRQYLLHFKDNN